MRARPASGDADPTPGSPYRTRWNPGAPATRTWRRRLVGAFDVLRASPWWRRWAGGRWAKYKCIYNATGETGFHATFALMDMAVEAVHGERAEVGIGYGIDLITDRWRRVDACPHEAMPFMVVGAAGGPAIERRRVPCTCEVWALTAHTSPRNKIDTPPSRGC